MQKVLTRVLILSIVCLNISFLEAQIIREQLRTLPVEITQAKLIGQDLYVANEDCLYHSRIDSIDFRRIYSGEISKIEAVGNIIVFDTKGSNTYPAIYCNQLAGLRGSTTLSTRSVRNGSNISSGNSISYNHNDFSTEYGVNYGFSTTYNGVTYSRIYRNSGWPPFNLTGTPVAIDQFGKRIGATSIRFSDFASDEEFYYATFQGDLYRSTSPTFDDYEILESTSVPSFSGIQYINGQLVSTNGGLYISEDQGLTWQEEEYPHVGLWFDDFKDGFYYFTSSDKKIKVRTDAYLSTEYDTIYNFTSDPFIDGKQLLPLNIDTLLLIEKQSIFISYDRGTTWQEKFTGFWTGIFERPAITDQARFFYSEDELWRTTDLGISFESINPKYISISSDTILPKSVINLKGHNNALFHEVTFSEESHSLFRSTDQGESFHEVFPIIPSRFYNGFDAIFALTPEGLHMSTDNGNDWTEIFIPEIQNLTTISDINQEDNLILIEDRGIDYYASYDLGNSFSKLKVPHIGSYKISLAAGRFFGIGPTATTWVKISEASAWVKVNDKASYFDLYPGSSTFSTTKIFAIGKTIYSHFRKAGYIHELCQSTAVDELQYSKNFGRTWSTTTLTGINSFTHNGDHYRYNRGLYRYSYDESLEPNSIPDLAVDIIDTNIQDNMTLGDTIQVTFQLANLSTSDTDASQLSHISLFKQGGPNYVSDTLPFAPYSAFEGSNYELSIPIDSHFVLGQHYVQFRTDIYNTVLESSVINNFARVGFNIVPKDTIIQNEDLELCEGETYNGVILEQDTMLEINYENIFSHNILLSNISVSPTYRDTTSAIICEGESFVVNNQKYSASGVYATESLLTSNFGCDSVMYLHLSHFENLSDTTILNIQQGGFFEDVQIFQDTIITEELYDLNGCLTRHVYDIMVDNTVSVNNQFERFFSVSPNPISEKVNIRLKDRSIINKIEIIDLNGRTIVVGNPLITNHKIEIDMSNFVSGIYFLRISDTERSYTSKIIKL